MSCGQVKNSLIVYFSLTRTSYLVTGQVKILMYLPGGQVKIFRFFYPCSSCSNSIIVGVVKAFIFADCIIASAFIALVGVCDCDYKRTGVKHAMVLLLRITVNSISNSITFTFCNSEIIR